MAFRWAIGGLLAGLLVAFHRMGVPLIQGRRALVVWVLVALLHVSAARTVALPLLDVAPEDAAAVLVIVPAAAPILLGTLLLLAFVLGCATLAAPTCARLGWRTMRTPASPPVHPFLASPHAPRPAVIRSDLQAIRLPHTISQGLTARASCDLQHWGADDRS